VKVNPEGASPELSLRGKVKRDGRLKKRRKGYGQGY
jgi:hypothetical protein